MPVEKAFRFQCSEIFEDSLAERSKAPDSSSGGAIRVGSNPTAVKFGFVGVAFGDDSVFQCANESQAPMAQLVEHLDWNSEQQ